MELKQENSYWLVTYLLQDFSVVTDCFEMKNRSYFSYIEFSRQVNESTNIVSVTETSREEYLAMKELAKNAQNPSTEVTEGL